ncbi:MAG: DUF58 domain-containing protein [Candidatus Eisenbacteria bacterium]|nr:DUF58 domain-containing protein [Candidatus Eisenbacteria bacterium]
MCSRLELAARRQGVPRDRDRRRRTETSDLLRKVSRLEIRSRHLVQDLFSGNAQSMFKGRGVEFEEVRPYVPGDEVRDIDWNVTARLGAPYVKRFVEERELTVMLVVDISRSMLFGTSVSPSASWRRSCARCSASPRCATTTASGWCSPAGDVEHFVPPARTHPPAAHVAGLLNTDPETKGTHLGHAAQFLTRSLRRRGLVFWISDFEDTLDPRDWRVLAKRHELTALALRDPREEQLREWAGRRSRTSSRATGVWWTRTPRPSAALPAARASAAGCRRRSRRCSARSSRSAPTVRTSRRSCVISARAIAQGCRGGARSSWSRSRRCSGCSRPGTPTRPAPASTTRCGSRCPILSRAARARARTSSGVSRPARTSRRLPRASGRGSCCAVP